MKFNGELKIDSIQAKRKIPVTRITQEYRASKDYRNDLKFYVAKDDYTDERAVLCKDNSPLCVGYQADDEKSLFICLKNKESYVVGRQIRTLSQYFEEVSLTKESVIELINSMYDLFPGRGGQEDKILRVIAWLQYILKRDYKFKYERADESVSYQISVDDKEKEGLINDMIASVDMKRFMQLLSIAGSGESYSKFANKDVAETLLRRWAEAKVGFYKLFGKQLYLEKEVSLKIDHTEMELLKEELKTKFPKYSFALNQTDITDLMKNELIRSYDHYDCWRDIPFLSRGMKISKAFASLYEDKDFDMGLSEVLQNREIKGILRISIDPYDYLTQSVNKHGWNSCHRITTGEYGTGPFSYMYDEVSLVAYRTNKLDYDYSFFGFKFKGNSKAWRANVIFDLATCGFAVGRQYPNSSEELETETKNILQEAIKNVYPSVSFNYVVDSFDNCVKDSGAGHYNDFLRSGSDKYLFFPAGSSISPNFVVGSVPSCVYCGKPVTQSGSRCSHGECLTSK
ncbi:MAG: hypothetical protein PHC62_06865 [Candidatus Izemoplasmatales bacterium]|nr:hypothetical protein [Candidatus Izemoplasmatales bacterium]